MDEVRPLLSHSNEDEQTPAIMVTRTRWWIIFVFFYCSMAQGSVWNTWGPINYALMIAYGWTDTFTALVAAMSNITLLVTALPVMYITQNRGLRTVMVLSMCSLMLTVSLWIIGLHFEMRWMIYVGGGLIGVATVVFMSVPPLLSVLWFPVKEWTTATAIGVSSGVFGQSIAFITEFEQDLKTGISNLVYYDAGLILAGFLMVLIYFPSQPRKPPSQSARVERIDFRNGLQMLARDGQFWLINIVCNLPNGVFGSWLPLLSVSFKALSISQETGGWIGLTTLLAGCVVSVLVSGVVDRFKQRMKQVILIMTIGQVLSFIFIVCIQQGYFHITSTTTITALLYTGCTLAGMFMNGVQPLYYELACECAFPVQEGLVSTLISWANNLFGLVFFMMFLSPALAKDTQWMTWLCLALCVVSLPLILCIKENYRRLTAEHASSVTI